MEGLRDMMHHRNLIQLIYFVIVFLLKSGGFSTVAIGVFLIELALFFRYIVISKFKVFTVYSCLPFIHPANGRDFSI